MSKSMLETSLFEDVAYNGSALKLFDAVTKDKKNTMLLESKDGNGKNNTQSLLFVTNAIRIEAKNNKVEFVSLSKNGKNALNLLALELEKVASVAKNNNSITAFFKASKKNGSDEERIVAPSVADSLRKACFGWERVVENCAPLYLPGVFSYDFLDCFEELPPAKNDCLNFADFTFFLPEKVMILNHVKSEVRIITHLYGNMTKGVLDNAKRDMGKIKKTVISLNSSKTKISAKKTNTNISKSAILDDVFVNIKDDEYCEIVKKCKENIVDGDVFQIVPSRVFEIKCNDALKAYGVLRELNPSPYLFYLNTGEFEIFGSSPETSVSIKGNPLKIQLHPIAGTRPRGIDTDGDFDPDMDNKMEAELKLNEKELAEHMMLVDLARNDVARVSKSGTRHVKKLLEVQRYSHVMHLKSVVEGELKENLDALHAYMASMNMGTLVGSPKIQAARLLREYEPDARGPYGGAIGYLASNGEMDLAIVIRSALVINNKAFVRAGAGIVYDSEPQAEADETRSKAMAVLKSIFAAKENQDEQK